MADQEVLQGEPSAFKIVAQGRHGTLGLDPKGEINERQVSAEPAKPEVQETKTEVVAEVAEPAKNEAKLTKVEQAPQGEIKTEPTQPTQSKTWEDSLKEQGFNEDAINLVKATKSGENLKPYLEAISTDVSKMTADQILRYNLQKTYPMANAEELELLYETEVKDKYKLDEDKYLPETVEAKAGKAKMRMDVEALRGKIQDELSKYKLPTFDREAETKRLQEEQSRLAQANVDAFYSDDYVKGVVKDKKIVLKNLGKDVPDFNFLLDDPSEVTAILTDPAAGARVITKDGKLDREAQLRIAAFAYNPEGFCQALISHGKSLGREELIEEKYNPPKPQGQTATPPKKTLNETFASEGINGRGGR